MNSIATWLNSAQDYDVGAALYEAHGTDDNLKVMFRQGHSTYGANRLREELLQVSRRSSSVRISSPARPNVVKVAVR